MQKNNYEILMLRKVKRNKPHFTRWPTYKFKEDEFGTWLYSPARTVHLLQDEIGRVVLWEVARGPKAKNGDAQLHLIPHNKWWVAFFHIGENGEKGIGIDISVPSTFENDEWTYVDLELDPMWNSTKPIELLDEDEFEEAIEKGLISNEEANNARVATKDIMHMLENGIEPYGKIGWEIFEQALNSQLPSIKYNTLEQISNHKIIL